LRLNKIYSKELFVKGILGIWKRLKFSNCSKVWANGYERMSSSFQSLRKRRSKSKTQKDL